VNFVQKFGPSQKTASKRLLFEQQHLNYPERDLEAQCRRRTLELEQSLREKRNECDNLDWRLKDRSEKLANVTLKMNENEKENIRFQKRIEKITETNKAELTNSVFEI